MKKGEIEYMIIDFDSPDTFPASLCSWDESFEKMIRSKLNLDNVKEGWKIKEQLHDLNIGEMPIVTNFVSTHLDTEVAVCHITRLLDKNQIFKEGLVTGGGRGSVAENRIRKILQNIGLEDEKINEIFIKIYYYWDRDKEQRTESVHFVLGKNVVYNDDRVNEFAVSLGGEVLRWSLENIDSNLYKQEPYKRLWVDGTPSIVKFKCKLSEVNRIQRNQLVAEIVKYFIVTKMFGYSYEFEFTGMTDCFVPAENIISIEEIAGFIEMQEKYPDFKGFYDDVK